MSFYSRHFLDFSNTSKEDVLFLFQQAFSLSQGTAPRKNTPYSKNSHTAQNSTPAFIPAASIALLFLEPSTRTKMSFELAAHDFGYKPLFFDEENSSLKKGELILDTLLNLQAMGVNLFVIRHGTKESLKDLSQHIQIPIVNAGEGTSGHPTQALLDAYTILQSRGCIEGEKVLIIGDSKYSRVAQSNLELLTILGAHVAYCGPQEFLPSNTCLQFQTLEEGMEWATVLMALRPQLERHSQNDFNKTRESFIKNYSLNSDRLASWTSQGVILHPGPYIREQEIFSDVLKDPRCKIFDQVKNGRWIRSTLLALILGDL